MPVSDYLRHIGFDLNRIEGYCQQIPQQIEDLKYLVSNINHYSQLQQYNTFILPNNYIDNPNNPNNKNKIHIMEIGFNAGHSAEIFLETNKNIHLTSFDLGLNPYVKSAKKFIDNQYPNRHTLIAGNSLKTIPEYVRNNPNRKFDLLFIDGGHDYETAKKDMENCYHLAHKDSIVILDDTVFNENWQEHYNVGPTQVWKENLANNKIIELCRRDYIHGRGMSWGKYIF